MRNYIPCVTGNPQRAHCRKGLHVPGRPAAVCCLRAGVCPRPGRSVRQYPGSGRNRANTPLPASAEPQIAKRLVRAIVSRRIPPRQPGAIDWDKVACCRNLNRFDCARPVNSTSRPGACARCMARSAQASTMACGEGPAARRASPAMKLRSGGAYRWASGSGGGCGRITAGTRATVPAGPVAGGVRAGPDAVRRRADTGHPAHALPFDRAAKGPPWRPSVRPARLPIQQACPAFGWSRTVPQGMRCGTKACESRD